MCHSGSAHSSEKKQLRTVQPWDGEEEEEPPVGWCNHVGSRSPRGQGRRTGDARTGGPVIAGSFLQDMMLKSQKAAVGKHVSTVSLSVTTKIPA